MAADDLDAFLGADKEPVPEAPPPEPTPEPEPQETEEAPQEADEEQDDAPPEPKPGERTVPLAALEKQRRDHKERAAKLEGERDALLRQLNEIKQAQQQAPAPQYQPPQPIDPVQDPAGYHAQVQQVVLNERLNVSEMMLRKELGGEAVDAAIAEFKQAMARDPSLQAKLYQQPDPYGWMAKQVEVMRFQREVGEDPKAYKERLRKEWEAEQAAMQPAAPVSPAVRMNPSLANVRSAAPRASGAWAGETPLTELFPPR